MSQQRVLSSDLHAKNCSPSLSGYSTARRRIAWKRACPFDHRLSSAMRTVLLSHENPSRMWAIVGLVDTAARQLFRKSSTRSLTMYPDASSPASSSSALYCIRLCKDRPIRSASLSRSKTPTILLRPDRCPNPAGDTASFLDDANFCRSCREAIVNASCPVPQYKPKSTTIWRLFKIASSNDANETLETDDSCMDGCCFSAGLTISR